jgi:hypothetical protein
VTEEKGRAHAANMPTGQVDPTSREQHNTAEPGYQEQNIHPALDSTLSVAKDLSWYVFPIKAGAKHPPLIKDMLNRASNVREQILTWANHWPGCNWGVSCGKSGLAVIDVDVKKNGYATYKGLKEEHGEIPWTINQWTPSGGFHIFTDGVCQGGVEILGPGVDVKSIGGYVVLAGSKTDVGEYRWAEGCEFDKPLPVLPWLLERMNRPLTRDAEYEIPLVDLDKPDAIAAATNYAREVEPSIEGQGGDNHLIQVVYKMRDLGVDEDTCCQLLSEHFNPRCEPPWDEDELEKKVGNGYLYAKLRPGNNAPEVRFPDVDLLDDPAINREIEAAKGQEMVPARPEIISAKQLLEKHIAEIVYVVPTLVPAGLIVLAGKPKIGKSWFALQLCLSVARATEFLGLKTVSRRVLYLALEDSWRRLQDRIRQLLGGLTPPDGFESCIEWQRIEKGGFEELDRQLTKNPDIRLVVIDVWQKIRPIAKPRGANAYEVDFNEASRLKKLADKHNIALILITHLRKPGRNTAGDPFDEVTGSTGITGAADTNMVLTRYRHIADAELHITGRDVDERKLALVRDARTGGWECIGTTEELQKTPERQKIVDALTQLGQARPKQIAEMAGLDPQYVRDTLPMLLKNGFVTRAKYGLYELAAGQAECRTPHGLVDAKDADADADFYMY